MTITILEIEQNSEQWLKEREDLVTGSISDVLLTRGLDEALKQNSKHFNGNYYTERGHILEIETIEVYEAVHNVKVERPGMVKNSKYPNAACSPDGIDKPYLLEVKCFALKKHMSILTAKDIPFKIMSQLQFNMMICGLKIAKLVMYNPDCEKPEDCYREIIVRANSSIQSNFKLKLKG